MRRWSTSGSASTWLSWPAVQHVGYDQFAQALREALRPLHVEGLGVRIVSEFGWVTGTAPTTS
ncbi:MAG TPA: hypothetical protein VGI66_01145 [Streptosporangiaceae bacterium]